MIFGTKDRVHHAPHYAVAHRSEWTQWKSRNRPNRSRLSKNHQNRSCFWLPQQGTWEMPVDPAAVVHVQMHSHPRPDIGRFLWTQSRSYQFDLLDKTDLLATASKAHSSQGPLCSPLRWSRNWLDCKQDDFCLQIGPSIHFNCQFKFLLECQRIRIASVLRNWGNRTGGCPLDWIWEHPFHAVHHPVLWMWECAILCACAGVLTHPGVIVTHCTGAGVAITAASVYPGWYGGGITWVGYPYCPQGIVLLGALCG